MNQVANPEIQFTNPCTILHNYQNAHMHISKPITYPTLINITNKVYELKLGPLDP